MGMHLFEFIFFMISPLKRTGVRVCLPWYLRLEFITVKGNLRGLRGVFFL